MDRKVIGIVNHDEWVISDFHSVTSGVPQNHCSGHNYLQPILMILTGYALKKMLMEQVHLQVVRILKSLKISIGL